MAEGSLGFRSAALSLRGGKQRNYDATLEDGRGVYAVADGVDARPFGDYYAHLGCAVVRDALLQRGGDDACLSRANECIGAACARAGERQGGACLGFASLLGFPLARVGSAGDVRVLLWREGKLADLLQGPHDCRCAAGTEGFSARYNVFQARRGDRLLLCTDGMWNAIGRRRIELALDRGGAPNEMLCRCMLGAEYADSASAVLVCI